MEKTTSLRPQNGISTDKFDDDGHPKRTGTVMTASAHIITAVIGSGVLSLAWAIAQLGWIAGPIALILFSIITAFTSHMLADCYRDPVTGTRNYTYMDAVRSNLGGIKVKLCGVAQYANLVGVTIGYTITTAISMASFPALQNTLKSTPPENVAMKKATLIGISVSTMFYMSCGLVGYAAFGNHAPGNFLTGFGFYEPFWLVDIANVCIIVHLVGAYQVFCQPIFGFVESWSSKRWPQSGFIAREYPIAMPFGGTFNSNLFRFVWRTAYVIFTTIIAMLLPFFNDFLGLLGASAFWPLTVYFPVEMYISQAKIRKFSSTWIWLQLLSLSCLIISLVAAAGSIQGLIKAVQTYEPFQSIS
ncbi:hypothetical protein TEA_003572 [Camellia sinensis var. sinensis]|uniref:Amino acid transporter transmembrane domain-containing protein n=1 Tax=Camellia sinensis var. sinensis TaxID=542762 RepID=A0A4S4DJY0_CAMSN|nr:hypothetical protein TEA_003572 [Camellia sinensis var. sinensis]